jgi:hypothetical protein
MKGKRSTSTRDEALTKKRLLIANMNTPTAGMFRGAMFGGGMPMFEGVMGAPPEKFVASMDPTISTSSQGVDEEEAVLELCDACVALFIHLNV